MPTLADTPKHKDTLVELIQAAIRKETIRIVEEEAQKASQEAGRRVRAMLGQIGTQVLSQMTYERLGSELIIRFDIRDSTKP